MRLGAALLASSLALASCASAPGVKQAERGDYSGLAKLIAADVDRGAFDARDAEDLARAVAKSEARRASGEEGLSAMRSLGACVPRVAGAIEDRARGSDEIAAFATLLLVDHGELDAIDFGDRARDARPWWRAVGARAMIGLRDGEARRRLLADGDERVRLAAVAAAAIAADPADLEALLDVARADPDPLAKTRAIHAVGDIGGERAVLALKDLWPRASVEEKDTICDAWSSRRSAIAGGARELAWAAESQRGEPAISAAFHLVDLGGEERERALDVLARAIADGSTEERIFSIGVAPLEPAKTTDGDRGLEAVRAAIVKAEDDKDDAVAIAAMGKRLVPDYEGGAASPSDERAKATKRMMELAGKDGPLAMSARRELARAGVKEIEPLLVKDVASKDPRARRAAGFALAAMGDTPHAAIAAADVDPSVRITTACAILNARK